jgi:hypothetical protein
MTTHGKTRSLFIDNFSLIFWGKREIVDEIRGFFCPFLPGKWSKIELI